MTRRYSNSEELRPLGEAAHIPDDKLSNSSGEEPQHHRIDAVDAGYPNHPTTTENECQSCGVSVPAT